MDYRQQYENIKMTHDQVATLFEDGWVCASDIAAAMPVGIMEALGRRAATGDLRNVRYHGMLDLEPNEMLRLQEPDAICPVSWFSGKGFARAVNEGRGDQMPCYYRDVPDLFREYISVNAFVADVSPMDEEGFFTTGTVGSYSDALIGKAERIFLEVNRCVPCAVNGPRIHISQVTALCEYDRPLPVYPAAEPDEISSRIGQLIAQEIPDGATLQLGIGAIPESVGYALRDKHDLGLHTELFTDGMADLIECGAVTNEKKTIHQGKTVATLAFGSKRVYDYIDHNPDFMFMPVDYVNSPIVISQHPCFISVNSALEVDFYGQVCSESIGTVHVSGSGGQADYVRGAVLSAGGKSFIAFPSTAKRGTVSRIAPILTPGSIVTTNKNDVECIVTEYGIARMRGRTLSQRTRALISIAHPAFREELLFEAKKRNILI